MVFNSFAHFASFGGFGPDEDKQDDDKDSRREFPAPAVPAALPEEEMSAEYPSIPEPEDKEIRRRMSSVSFACKNEDLDPPPSPSPRHAADGCHGELT